MVANKIISFVLFRNYEFKLQEIFLFNPNIEIFLRKKNISNMIVLRFGRTK